MKDFLAVIGALTIASWCFVFVFIAIVIFSDKKLKGKFVEEDDDNYYA